MENKIICQKGDRIKNQNVKVIKFAKQHNNVVHQKANELSSLYILLYKLNFRVRNFLMDEFTVYLMNLDRIDVMQYFKS